MLKTKLPNISDGRITHRILDKALNKPISSLSTCHLCLFAWIAILVKSSLHWDRLSTVNI